MPLPHPDQRPWLLEQLGLLLAEAGRTRFVDAPLLEAMPSSEPEGQIRALLGHLGLPELQVELEPIELDTGGLVPGGRMCGRSGRRALRLVEDQGLRLRWGLRGDLPPDTASLCHEISHLWRHRRGLSVEDPELEELLTDLTAVYLGFGLACVEGPRERREVVAGLVVESRTPGALGSESLCFLLGAQLAARDLSERQLQRLLGRLPRPQGEDVRAAIRHFRRAGRAQLDELLTPLVDDTGQLVELPEGARPVQRLGGHLGVAGAAAGVTLGLGLGLMGVAAFDELRSLSLMPLAGMLGGLVGWSIRRSRCSGCGTNLGDQDVLCPGCGGLLTDSGP